MAIQEAIKAIIRTLNIKNVDAFVAKKLEDEISNIPNPEVYIRYFEKNHNHIDLTGKTGYQKFLYLNDKYKEGLIKVLAKKQLGEANSRAKELAKKVRETKSTFEEAEYQRIELKKNIKQLHFGSFGNFFSKEDISILSIVGPLKKCLEIQKLNSGSDLLLEKLDDILSSIAIKQVKTEYLLAPPSKQEQKVLDIAKQAYGAI